MAERTPSTIIRGSLGEFTLHVAEFADLDNADTWASGIQGIVSIMAVQTSASTGTVGLNQGAGATLTTASTGLITVFNGEDAQTGTLWVISRS